MPKNLNNKPKETLPLLRQGATVISEEDFVDIMTNSDSESDPKIAPSPAQLRPARSNALTKAVKSPKVHFFSLLSKTKKFTFNSQFIALLAKEQMKLPKFRRKDPEAYKNLQKAIQLIRDKHLIFAQSQKIKKLQAELNTLKVRLKTAPASNITTVTAQALIPAYTESTKTTKLCSDGSNRTPKTKPQKK